VKVDCLPSQCAVVPSPDSTLGAGLESMKGMTKAALYARVSADRQKQEQTIESQVAELKRQITAAGHVLVKEYVDDGYSGAYLDRPALDQLRLDVKTDAFDVAYFLCADRIARDTIHQTIIVGEFLRYKKRISTARTTRKIPKTGSPLQVLGAVAQFERAKIIERTRRGALHHVRAGKLISQGHTTFGYRYMRKTTERAAHLLVDEEQAAVIRSVFEMFASGHHSLNAILRSLERQRVPTAKGKSKWHISTVKRMLQNSTYAGTRHYNRYTNDRDVSGEGKRPKRGKQIVREQQEWIGVNVPAIVSQELFEQAQERLRGFKERYCQPVMHYLLSGLSSAASAATRIARPAGTSSLCARPGTSPCTTGRHTGARAASMITRTTLPSPHRATTRWSRRIFSMPRSWNSSGTPCSTRRSCGAASKARRICRRTKGAKPNGSWRSCGSSMRTAVSYRNCMRPAR
jgi:site-specific DNA recombinase